MGGDAGYTVRAYKSKPARTGFSTAKGDSAMLAIIGSNLLSSKAAQPTKQPFEISDSRCPGFTLICLLEREGLKPSTPAL